MKIIKKYKPFVVYKERAISVSITTKTTLASGFAIIKLKKRLTELSFSL